MAEVKALLAAAEEAEEKCRRYGKLATLLDKLALVLYIPAFVATVAGLVVHMLYSMPQIVIAGLALWFAGYVAYILRDVYSGKAVKAARQACVFRRTAEAVAEIERIMMKLGKEVGEVEQELKKRGIARESSAD
jgi:hypothetical protein